LHNQNWIRDKMDYKKLHAELHEKASQLRAAQKSLVELKLEGFPNAIKDGMQKVLKAEYELDYLLGDLSKRPDLF